MSFLPPEKGAGMAETGRKIGKLALAIVEHFVESKLGEKFVKGLRAPTDEKIAIEKAMQAAADRLWAQWRDERLWRAAFDELPEKEELQQALKQAVRTFYQHPTNTAFANVLATILRERKEFSEETIRSRVGEYLAVLTEELALADETFRENVRALADLHGERWQREMVDILRRVEQLLAGQTPRDAGLRNLHQLPPPPRDFIERPKELAELRQAFHNGRAAAICGLTGMGGVGKTTLGLAFARGLAQDYPDAQLFLDLKGTAREPEQPLAPAEAMRYVIHAFKPEADLRALSEAELAALYCSCLDGKKALLFLDNARSAEQVKPLLPPPSCAVLITSRWRFPLPGLKTVDVGVMAADEAEAFLRELCPRIGAHAAALAKACAYLPLALRIAGSFLAVNADWTLPEYLGCLQSRRLETLASAEDAERDLETVFAESYETLSEDERRLWRLLAVFPAAFDRPAAAAVWNLDEPAAHDLLSRLCRYSLLDFIPSPLSPLPVGEGGGGEGRYSLHELLRDFARARLTGDESQAAALRHAEHYRRVLSRADDLYLQGGENIRAGLALFDREAEHIRAGQAWAAARSPELCNAYPKAGTYVLDLRLTPKEKIAWLEAALQAARCSHDRAGEGVHLGNLGLAYADLGDARQAIEFYEQALAIDREIGDRRGEAFGSWNLGLAYEKQGEIEKAIQAMQICVDFEREIGHPDAEQDARRVEELRKKLNRKK